MSTMEVTLDMSKPCIHSFQVYPWIPLDTFDNFPTSDPKAPFPKGSSFSSRKERAWKYFFLLPLMCLWSRTQVKVSFNIFEF